MPSSSSCPADNSTQAVLCLLRVISNNTRQDWSWDPLNFAVTAAIGVLALIIASITVFQGLLAAGPGRLKASKTAIGPFSIHSRSRLDRTELALRTTARVPLITWDVVFHRIVRQKFRPNSKPMPNLRRRHNINDGEAAQEADESGDGVRAFDTNSIKERHRYDSTATWLTLLTALGLDDPQFFPLVQRVTDYLPADVQAAPAAAELRCLAILAVIADSGATIEPAANRFIRVSADSSQLVFRDHPVMGAVAAYEAYEETAMLKVGKSPPLQFGSQFQPLRFEDLDRCLQLASGRLAYANARIPPSLDGVADERSFLTLVTDLRKRSWDCGHDICTHAYEDWSTSLTGIRDRKKAWRYITAMRKLYMSASLLAAERANMCRGFPKTKMMLTEGLEAIVKLNEFWSTELTSAKMYQLSKVLCLTFWKQSSISYKDSLSASWVVNFKGIQSTVPNPFLTTMRSILRQHFKQDKTFAFMQKIRTFVSRLLDPAERSLDGFEEHKLPLAVQVQLLACLDEWLLRSGGAAASCCMLRLLYRLGSQLELLTVIRDDSAESNFLLELIDAESHDGGLVNDMLGKSSLDSTPGCDGDSKILDGIDMSMLLVLRGVLLAMLLDDGADTSILYHSDFRNLIVRML